MTVLGPCGHLPPAAVPHPGVLCAGRCVHEGGHDGLHKCACGATWGRRPASDLWPEVPGVRFNPGAPEDLELPDDDAPEPDRDDPAERARARARTTPQRATETAQLFATLSVSEELRTANLIAAYMAGDEVGQGRRLADLIRSRLGLS